MSGVLKIEPVKLSGEVSAPPSKSYAHRAVIAAALARGHSEVANLELSQDIEATVGAVTALGARVSLHAAESGGHIALIKGIEGRANMPHIDCGESGSTLRFLLPVALATAGGAVFTGSGRLGQRPLGPYVDLFREQGIIFEQCSGGFPITVQGTLKPGRFAVPGNISSQFITGLLLALPGLGGQSEIEVVGELESLPYVDITIDVLKRFGVAVAEAERGRLYRVGAQPFLPQSYRVESDWSQSAFLLLMGLLGGSVAVGGLNRQSTQGDRVIEDIYRGMGGNLLWQGDKLTATASQLHGIEVNVSQCPDLAPAIAAAMALAAGRSAITGGKRLRDKESDRLAAIAGCLGTLGADITETQEGLVITGKAALTGGAVQSCNDHRIAMMAAAVSGACASPVVLEGFRAVAKSWPGFWGDFKGLGGNIHEQPVG